MSVALRLADDVDVSRGDVICAPDTPPQVARELEADVCWMDDAPMRPGARYAIKKTTHSVRAVVEELRHRIDVHTLEPDGDAGELGLNDIGRVRLGVSAPLAVDQYRHNRTMGSFIFIDEATNNTVGAGMVVGAR
jgi:bifunctional enzyme CysN/CysC